tara:strand:- start:7401 stop:7961 length:561 start_codon:yes stop_codon:yes gene_type:complete
MKKFLIFFYLFNFLYAQIIATTKDGKQVILNNDGTWKYEESKIVDEENIGLWSIGEDINPIDDTKTFTAILNAKSGKSKWGDKVYLVLRYKSGESEVYINWGSYLGNAAFVITRIGSQKANKTQWSISTDKKATFYKGSAIDFIGKLKNHDKAVFQVTPYGENPITAIFDIKGLSAAISSYSYTGW